MKPILERVAIVLILAGIVFLCQPFLFTLYRWGFPVLLVGTIGFIIISHVKG